MADTDLWIRDLLLNRHDQKQSNENAWYLLSCPADAGSQGRKA